jgi:hypothetical protein
MFEFVGAVNVGTRESPMLVHIEAEVARDFSEATIRLARQWDEAGPPVLLTGKQRAVLEEHACEETHRIWGEP